MKKCCVSCICFTLCWLFLCGTLLRQERLSAGLIRLHVLANSDSPEDQQIKLQVRDAVLESVTSLTADCTDRKSAARQLILHAEQLAAAASSVAAAPVTVSLSEEWYDTRHYDHGSLPAGEYLSLQIGIGEAAGKNWWCVAFPSVCTAATADAFEAEAAAAGFGEREIRMMTEDTPDIRVRFFLLELIGRVKRWMQA